MSTVVVCPECHSPIILGAKGKTVTRSFRIDEAALGALEEEAERRNMSVNTFLNQQILSFAKFDRFFMRIGLVKLSGNTLQRLIDASTETAIAEAAVVAARDTPRAIMLSKHGQVTIETTLEYIRTLSEFANLFECSISHSLRGQVVTLAHQFGPKGSMFFANYVKTLFELVGISPVIRTSPHSVDFEIISSTSSVV
jgi:non-homologous end joining protein Ku